MRRTAVALLAIAGLAIAGCSSPDGEPQKTVTVTATTTPSLSAAAARRACVDAWTEVVNSRPADFDPETDEDPIPSECDGLPDQVEMYWEAESARTEANRRSLDACLEDPTCTSWPLPSP